MVWIQGATKCRVTEGRRRDASSADSSPATAAAAGAAGRLPALGCSCVGADGGRLRGAVQGCGCSVQNQLFTMSFGNKM